MAVVEQLNYYPIKSCAGTSVRAADLGHAGLTHDRSFMVVGLDGVFRSQRRDPLLTTVHPMMSDDGSQLSLRAAGFEDVTVPVVPDGPRRRVELFGTPFGGIDQGDVAADWFSHALGAQSRLVRVPPDHDRVTSGEVAGTSGYADGCAVLMLSRSSMAGLNERLAARRSQPLPMDRFRANIVVAGWDEPHTEDLVRRVEIGGARLAFAERVIRCAVTTVDQQTGRKNRYEPLRTLADYRREPGGVAFGTNFAVLSPGRLAVGDELSVSRWG